MSKLYNLPDRIANRIMRHFPKPNLQIGTDRPIVSFTFDDVPATALAGASILESFGVRGTFYIAGGLAGHHEAVGEIITAPGIQRLAAAGHEIGCHTFSHPNARRLTLTALDEELSRNERYLAKIMPGYRASNFAFPFNLSAPHARGSLSNRFRSCRGGWEGINRGPTDSGYLRAVEISPASGAENPTSAWLDDVAQQPGWLIFFTHGVELDRSPYGCTPAILRTLVGKALDLGCAVLPIDAALDVLAGARSPAAA